MNNSTVGQISYIARIGTKQLDKDAKDVESKVSNIGDSNEKQANRSTQTWSRFAKVGLGAVIGAAVAVGAAITTNIGGAIARVDTLNNSKRTFANMGFEASEAKLALDELNKSILGLPTSLDAGVRGMTQLAATYGSISTGQKVFTALNNAILGFGGTADEVNNAIIQLSQLPMDGPLDAQTWLSLRNSGLTPVLVAMAKDMGISINKMKAKFGEGELTVKDFTDRLIKMNKDGGGGMKSLEKIAQDSTKGIGTGFANMGTAIQRGIAKVIEAIGSAEIAKAISSIGSAFEKGLTQVASFINFVVKYKDIFAPIAVTVGVLAAAFIGWSIGIFAVTTAQLALNAALAANPIGLIIIGIAALVAGLVYFFTQTKIGKKIVQTVFKAISVAVEWVVDAIKNVSKWFTEVWEGIKKGWGAVAGFFVGIWTSVMSVFTSVVDWIKEWGKTILAIIFFPFAILLGLIFKFKVQIIGFFTEIWNGIVTVFSAIVGFITGVFTAAYNVIVAIFSPIVGFYASIFKAAWNIIVTIFGAIGSWFAKRWNDIVTVFSVVGSFFYNVFSSAWKMIKSVFAPVGSFFAGVWKTIVGLFSGVGTAVGNAIGGAFKGVINSVLKFAVNTINGFIKAINGAIDIINNIPGVKIGTLGTLPIPQLAEGGIVMPRAGGVLANIAEAGQAEAVIPLDKLDKMLSGNGGGQSEINIGTINIADQSTADYFIRKLSGNQEITSVGLIPNQKYMGA